MPSSSPQSAPAAAERPPEPGTRAVIVGCGGMARNHLKSILDDPRGTCIPVVCEPVPENYALTCELFAEAGVESPVNIPDLQACLAETRDELDAAFIVTPHAMHHEHAMLCLDAGLEVLLEKPMVVNQDEARSLIARRDETDGLLVVAFQGSLSPQVRWASEQLRAGAFGTIQAISGTVWQNWRRLGTGRWRADPKISGGGFMFDTGAHMMNTIADLAGEEFVEVAAWIDNTGAAVDIMTAAMARLQSGAFVTMNACGAAVPSCSSDIRIFCERANLRVCMWGRWVEVQHEGESELTPVVLPAMKTAWHRFLDVRHGRIENPSPPEVGLRMLKLWDAIKASAAQGGQPVRA